MALAGGQWTVAATAASVAGALSIPEAPEKRLFTKVTVKNADGAANNLYVGRSNVTATPTNALVELGAGDSYTFGGYEGAVVDTAAIYMIGTAAAANIAFIALE